MPRGRKTSIRSIEEQIARIDTQLESYKRKIAKARERRRALMLRREKEEMTALYRAVRTSGKTAGEFLDAIGEKKEA